ncbi:TBC1 domain family member whacked-like isoform X2 [Venturia canescens]|uniref:TBC1 domain family member whacked-like isoform X2 n=1 Tax=Venturia canescens TaxID=32260 RepID=UPI001C9C0B4F|nr:TBC1 domain family member whacked-like isoform X2 [Venturia canescens]
MDNGIGYFRSQGNIAALLLMQMPPEPAFWTLVAITKNHLANYSKRNASMLQRDGQILQDLLKRESLIAYSHLEKLQIDPRLYTVEWFSNLYTLTLPYGTLLRIWDMFVYEGRAVIFKVAVALIKGCLGGMLVERRRFTLSQTLEILRQPPGYVVEEESLIREVRAVVFSDDVCWQQKSAGQSLKRQAEDSGAEVDPKRQ